MTKPKERRVGIYVRLSKEDDHLSDSTSIENQKLLLTKHTVDQGWELIDIYCDDGFSGTNQNRPALQRMLQDVTENYINTILIKDLSRLGRNYLEVGNLAEVFLPEHGCELISLAETLDEMMVFYNWFNEQHSRETSKKVKAVKKLSAEHGKFMGAFAPYGYIKSAKNKHLLVPDETAAAVVKEIFMLRAKGEGYTAIASHLNNAGILPPRDYYYQKRDDANPFHISHNWCTVTIKNILTNEIYIGNTVSLKYGTISYKNQKMKRRTEDEWIHAKNTHYPIINMELWEQVQSIATRKHTPRKRSDGSVSIFSGFLVCGGCGFKMRSATQKKVRKSGNQYVHINFLCGTYSRSGKSACSPHTIGENTLYQIVLEQIKTHACLASHNEIKTVERIHKKLVGESAADRAAASDELNKHKSRLDMLDKLTEKLFEDRFEELVAESTFKDFMCKYEQERDVLQQTVQAIEKQMRSFLPYEGNVNKWVSLMKQHAQIESLDTQTIFTLIDRIIIGDRIEATGAMVRDVKIVYKYVGDVSWLEERAGDIH